MSLSVVVLVMLGLVACRRMAFAYDRRLVVLALDAYFTLAGLLFAAVAAIYLAEYFGAKAVIGICIATGLLVGYLWGRRGRGDRTVAGRPATPSSR